MALSFISQRDAAGDVDQFVNMASYLTAKDLEREKVLESFGVQMIRLNRYNLGKDPVTTIDRLLRRGWMTCMNGRQPHELVKELAEKTNEIEEGLKKEWRL